MTNQGKGIMQLDPKRRNLELVKAILSRRIFNSVLSETLENSEKPDRDRIISIMSENLSELSQSTLNRRAQTVEKWIDWILQLTSA